MASAFHVYFGPEALTAPITHSQDRAARLLCGAEGRARRFRRDADPCAVSWPLLRSRGDRARDAVVVRQCLATRVPVRGWLCVDRAVLRCRPLRVEPQAGSRAASLVERRFRRFPLAGAPVDHCARLLSLRHLGPVGRRGRIALRPAVRPQAAGGRGLVPCGRADERPRLAAHSLGRTDRILLRGAGAVHQRHLLSADARPRRRRSCRRSSLRCDSPARIPGQSRCGASSSRRRLFLARCPSSWASPSSCQCSATPHGGSIAGRSSATLCMRFPSMSPEARVSPGYPSCGPCGLSWICLNSFGGKDEPSLLRAEASRQDAKNSSPTLTALLQLFDRSFLTA